jgi:Tat protein secretion system quality control protein TatD with DNase activity
VTSTSDVGGDDIQYRVNLGYHPWFSHLISLERIPQTDTAKEMHYRSLFLRADQPKAAHIEALDRLVPSLPHPFALEDLVADVRANIAHFIELHKQDAKRSRPMLGEVGVDRSFRIPSSPHRAADPLVDDGGSGQRLTPLQVPIAHQISILEAQLAIAVELNVNVSMHSVGAPAHTRQVFDKARESYGVAWTRISIDLHSCGLSVDAWRDIEVGLIIALNGTT